MKPEIKVGVEVTAETTMNGRKQLVYVDLGKKYPVEHEIWVPDSGPLAPGSYLATECYFSSDKWPSLLVGLNNLKAAK